MPVRRIHPRNPCFESMHETTETSNANMQCPKSLKRVSESDPKERNELESQLSTMGNALARRHSRNSRRIHAIGIAQVSSHLWDKHHPVVVCATGMTYVLVVRAPILLCSQRQSRRLDYVEYRSAKGLCRVCVSLGTTHSSESSCFQRSRVAYDSKL